MDQQSLHPTVRSRATWRWVVAAIGLVAFQVLSVLVFER